MRKSSADFPLDIFNHIMRQCDTVILTHYVTRMFDARQPIFIVAFRFENFRLAHDSRLE